MSDKFYITTAIDYPNGSPHMGHAYEKIVTDAYARWNKLLEKDVRYLTGTDENGQKLIESAEAQGLGTREYVDQQVEKFRKLCDDLHITHDDFIRTTEQRHIDMAQHFWKTLEEKGDIYSGKYSGQYCIHCESFYTDLQAPDKICPEHKTELKLKEEEGFFFKLSRFQDWIVEFLEKNPTFVVPKHSSHELLTRLKREPLRDLAISRPGLKWGVPAPGHNDYVMYTWFDAVINYYSALSEEDKRYWPADMHVIGKDILWFHAALWPCMLNAMDLPLPKQVYVHGMILAADGRKMSKSLNNGVDPNDILSKYPLDAFRYYLLRNIPASGDGSFSENELVDKNNNELGNDYGNLLMRVIKLSLKNHEGPITAQGLEEPALDFSKIFEKMQEMMEKREHNRALDILWEGINRINQYVNDSEPWKLKKEPKEFEQVIYQCLYGIHQASLLLSAYLPDCTQKALGFMGQTVEAHPRDLKFGKITYNLTTPDVLFPKIEIK